MKKRTKTIESNIYQLETKQFEVEMNFINPKTGRKSKKRRVFPILSDAKKWKEEFQAKRTLGSLPIDRRQRVTLGEMVAKVKELKADRRTFEDISRHLDEIQCHFSAESPLNQITTPLIQGFIERLKKRPKKGNHRGFLSNQSIDHVLKELRYLLRQAHKMALIEKVPDIPFVRNYGYRDFKLDMDGFMKVLKFLPEPPYPHRAMLLMALNTGQRLGDLYMMTWDQVYSDHVIYRSSKTQKESIRAPLMPVTREALDYLAEHSNSNYIFVNPGTGKPLRDIRKSLTTACVKAGIERFTIHHMRHLATTVLLQETNGDRDLVKRVIGWSSMEMIDRYGHIGHRAIPAFANINAKLTEGLAVKNTAQPKRRHPGDTKTTKKQEVALNCLV